MSQNRKIQAILGAVAMLLAGLSSVPSAFAIEADASATPPAVSAAPAQASPELDHSGWPVSPPSGSAENPSFASPFVHSGPRPVAPFPILLNRAVQNYVTAFLDQPDGLKLAFERSRPFLAEMVRVMKSQGVPDDLVYLTFAESGFSKRGRGPWQFSRGTARRFGLHVDKWVDERRDPILSTRAAAEYLAELHDQTDDDWRVALIGWNMGEQYLDRYWLLKGSNYNKFENRLPRRTRQLLGRFMAVAFIAHNSAAYGIGPVSDSQEPPYQVHQFKGGTTLAAIAHRYGVALSRLRFLNPALLSDRIPAYARTYQVRIPLNDRAAAF